MNTCAATATVLFNTNPATVTVDIEPGAVNWTCVSAKDRQHTLRSRVSLQLSGDIYTASFTGADKLIGGDLTDDNLVDILDFGVFSGQCGDDYGGPFAPPAKDANINGDGVVWSEDFSYIKAHFLELGDDPCQGAAAVSEPTPRDSMIMWEMAYYLGYNAALSADINHDRWVNSEDVELFIKKYLKPKRTR